MGTLTIVLPSAHSGGAVEAVFQDNREMIETASSPELDISYLAWYADVEHTVHEITSGHRLVLDYHLFTNEATRQQAATVVERKKLVPSTLRAIRRSEQAKVAEFHWPFAYMLEHKYSESKLRFDHLKGLDHVRTQILQQACEDEGFVLGLAHIKYEVSGYCDEPYAGYGGHCGDPYNQNDDIDAHDYNVHEQDHSFTLMNITLIDGQECVEDVVFKEVNILQPEWFENRDKDEKRHDPDGETTCTTHYYRDSCLLILPRNRYEDLILGSTTTSLKQARALLHSLVHKLKEAKRNSSDSNLDSSIGSAKSQLGSLCRIFLRNSWLDEQLFTAAIILDEPSVIYDLARRDETQISEDQFLEIGRAMPFEVSVPGQWKKATAIAAQMSRKISTTWAALSAVRVGFEESFRSKEPMGDYISVDSLRGWAFSVLEKLLKVVHVLDNEDVQSLISAIHVHNDVKLFLSKIVLPFIKRNMTDRNFTLIPLCFIQRVREWQSSSRDRHSMLQRGGWQPTTRLAAKPRSRD